MRHALMDNVYWITEVYMPSNVNSNTEHGYSSSKFCRTVGCRIPMMPISLSLLAELLISFVVALLLDDFVAEGRAAASFSLMLSSAPPDEDSDVVDACGGIADGDVSFVCPEVGTSFEALAPVSSRCAGCAKLSAAGR